MKPLELLRLKVAMAEIAKTLPSTIAEELVNVQPMPPTMIQDLKKYFERIETAERKKNAHLSD